MTPHADFACNSKTCKTTKGATVYDLPVKATACPVCRSRRIIRLFTPPNISRGIAKRSDRVLGPDYERQHRVKSDAKEAQRKSPMFAVPMNQLQGTLARFGASVPVEMGTARPTVGITSPEVAGLKAQGMVKVPSNPLARKMDNDRAWKSTGGSG
jgi:hypothetical protein